MIRPLAVLGVMEAAVIGPLTDWIPEAVAKPAAASNAEGAAPAISNRIAVEPEISAPMVDRRGPTIVVPVAAAAA
jgi:hypothetical protein